MSDRDSAPDRSSWRRTGFVIAACFVTLVAALAVVVVVTATPGQGHKPPAATTPGSTATQPSAAGGQHGCHLTDTSQAIPDAPPADVTWTVYKTVAEPVSRSAGPGIVDAGGGARCFAHTPLGALIATWQIGTRFALADDWRTVTLQQVMPGPGRDIYMRRRAAVTDNSAQPGEYGQIAGFKFVTYTPQTAVIQIVSRFSDGSMQVSTMTVVWSGGDWKLQLTPDGSESPTVQPVSSLVGFVVWGGV